jgi:HEAT repeat protein
MYAAVVWTVIVLGIVVVAASVLVVIGRLVADWWRARRARVSARMQERLSAFLAGAAEPEAVVAALRRSRPAATMALVSTAAALAPDERPRLTPIFRELGLIDQERDALTDRHWSRRLRAAERLGFMGGPAEAGALINALHDELLDVRLAAGRSLAQLRAPEAIEPVLRALAVHGELPIRLASDILVEFGEGAVAPLIGFLDQRTPGSDTAAAVAAVTVLGLLRADRAVPALITTLQEADPELRIASARALGVIASTQALDALCGSTQDKDWPVRSAACRALGQVGDGRAILWLQARLSDSQWWVRFNAAEALVRLGAPGRRCLRETSAGDEDRYARDISRQVLEEHPESGASGMAAS